MQVVARAPTRLACDGRDAAMTVRELLNALPADERLASGLARAGSSLDAEATGGTLGARRATPGCGFVALRGLKADGVTFAPQAIAGGASAVVAERAPESESGVPWLVVKDARLAVALMAAEFFRHPSRQMQVVGITGTNGKTTTSYLVSTMLYAAG